MKTGRIFFFVLRKKIVENVWTKLERGNEILTLFTRSSLYAPLVMWEQNL